LLRVGVRCRAPRPRMRAASHTDRRLRTRTHKPATIFRWPSHPARGTTPRGPRPLSRPLSPVPGSRQVARTGSDASSPSPAVARIEAPACKAGIVSWGALDTARARAANGCFRGQVNEIWNGVGRRSVAVRWHGSQSQYGYPLSTSDASVVIGSPALSNYVKYSFSTADRRAVLAGSAARVL
jgi:hypothetical protein